MFVEGFAVLYMLGRAAEQVWVGVGGFLPNNAAECRLQAAKM